MAPSKTICKPAYGMKEVCEQTGLNYETLKFYCNAGLVPGVERDEYNHRLFTAEHVEWLKSLHCLRNCGLSISEMKEYTKLCLEGESSIPRRQEILRGKLKVLQQKQQDLENSMKYIHKKLRWYHEVQTGKRPYISNLLKLSGLIERNRHWGKR
ncbi:MerR family transcriptional regulator [bacterium]|nr:MerR family transcriptional regulator [bacterium]